MGWCVVGFTIRVAFTYIKVLIIVYIYYTFPREEGGCRVGCWEGGRGECGG